MGGPRRDDGMRVSLAVGQNDLERDYIARMRAESASEETIRQRITVLRMLGVNPADATVEDVLRVMNRDVSAASRATYFRTLRVIFADFQRMGVTATDPTRTLKPPKTSRREPRPITPAEVEALLGMSDENARAWSILGLFAGLRASEVVSLTGESLRDGPHGPVLHVVGKGNLDALIPAHDRVVTLLRPFSGPDLIWPIWSKSMTRAWQRAAKDAGVTGRTFHQLRHTYATRLYQATGGDLLTVAALCRHASVATTQNYARVASDAPFRAINGI